MLKRLETNALSADLAAVDAILEKRTRQNDPLGWLQFTERRNAILEQLSQLDSSYRTTAAVGLFFGGRPVLGSHGILADFGAKAIEQFQLLLSTNFASNEGPLGARGPVRQRDRSNLAITNVARGSFGFILEQSEDEQLVDTPLKKVLGDTVDLVYRVSAPDQQAFDVLTESVDARVLGVLRSFFKLLADAGAILRIVDESREFLLSRENVERGYERTETLSLEDKEERLEGRLYLLPKSKRFDLTLSGDETISGTVSDQALTPLLDFGGDGVLPGVIGETVVALVRKRDILSSNRVLRSSYVLLGVQSGQSRGSESD